MSIKKLVSYLVEQDNFVNQFTAPDGLTKEQIEQLTGRAASDLSYETQITSENTAITEFQTLPAFLKTLTADEAQTYIHGAILSGKTEAQINADIDALANTVAGMKIGLKTIGASLVAIRDILELVVKLLLYIRDLVIKYRQQ